MQGVDVLAVPYDSGRRGFRMGAGPDAFLKGKLPDTLRAWGHDVRLAFVEADGHEPLPAAVDLATKIAQHVRRARADGRFPLLLAGNCIHTLGAAAALSSSQFGVAWFDAHGDLNTPATSPSGFLDGMAAATLLGWCHMAEVATIPGFRSLDESRLLFLGCRDLDPGELEAAERSRITLLAPHTVRTEAAFQAFDIFAGPLESVYLHIDLDVLDPAEHGAANSFASPGGMTLYETIRVVQELGARRPIVGMTISAYDPAVDADGLVMAAALPLISEALLAAVPADGRPGK